MLSSAREPAAPYRLGIILLPGFSLMTFASCIEPLRMSNYVSGKKLFDWQHLSVTGGDVAASCGLAVPTTSIKSLDPQAFSMILVSGGVRFHNRRAPEIARLLSKAERHGVMIGALSTGSVVLAEAGLLDNRSCAMHWDGHDTFKERYPSVRLRDALFARDGMVMTCAGGTACIDMMLSIIADRYGQQFSNLVADQFVHGPRRDSTDEQRMHRRIRLHSASPLVVRAVTMMEDSVQSSRSCRDIATGVGTSLRNLERLFQMTFKTSPRRYFMQLRLDRAQRLLRQTTMSVTEVGMACGFDSLSHFSKCYRANFGASPRSERAGPVVIDPASRAKAKFS